MIKNRKLYRWGSTNAYLQSILQNVIGIGNVTMFFFAFVKKGGLVMLIPLTLLTLMVGFPVMYMELLIGQAFRRGSLEVWNELCPFLKGLGYSYILQTLFRQMYYLALLGPMLDWFLSTLCYPNMYNKMNNSVFSNITILKSNEEDFIGFNPEYLPSFLLVLVICYACTRNGALSISRMASFFFIYSNIAVFVLIVKGLSSPLSFYGIQKTFEVDWKQLKHLTTWVKAVNIITTSGSLGTGMLINFSSCIDDYPVDLKTFSAVILVLDLVFGVLSSIQVSVALKTIILTKPEFVAFNVIQYMPAFYQSLSNGWLFAIICNLHWFVLSLTTVFTDIEQIHIALTYRFWFFKQYVELSRLILLITIGCLSSICLTKYGNSIINYFIDYGGKCTAFLLIAMESLAICYSYSFDKFYNKVDLEERERPGRIMNYAWAFFIPILYIVMFVLSFVTFDVDMYRQELVELTICVVILIPIPLHMIYYHVSNSLTDRLNNASLESLKFD
ncbi:hypothetical protein GJ496_004482 [Pomphorhynchus laevis]|nr:hypothetical protein GJ496_004482 [Pomphorhynchus laevis]